MTGILERLRAEVAGRYEIVGEIGRGGMATVLRAHDLKHDRPVALKVLHPEVALGLGGPRFLNEVRITARLSHPHILPLLDSGGSGELLYYVMPLVEGESLRTLLDRGGPLPVADAVRLAREVADALHYAHARGIVHRDIKPENILLESGHALVADFGIARAVDSAGERLTATGVSIGTPAYMSPEQAAGEREVDARSDTYSLACVLHEMLAGAPPFTGPTAQAMLARRLTEPAPSVRQARTTVPEPLDAALRRALERVPADRFRTIGEFADALGATVSGEVPAATGATVGTSGAARAAEGRDAGAPARDPALARQRRLFLGLAAAVALLALGWNLWQRASRADEAAATIAVLPFTNLSADPEQEYFADGLTDELISGLSRVEGLQVASRTSAFTFKGASLDLREIGRRLGVASVVEGSVRRGDGRIRVSVRLVSVADGYQRWTESYDRAADEALGLQREIAGAITETLRGRLAEGTGGGGSAGGAGGAGGGTVPAHEAAVDPAAYDLYLRGRYLRFLRTREATQRAVEHFQRAVAIAPDFARAHVGLGETYAVQGFYDYVPPREAFPAAERAAREALRIDPRLGIAHAVLGYVALYHHWDWSGAEGAFRRAIAFEPENATVHQWYANFLTARGRFAEAEAEMREALRRDPLLLIANAALGWVHWRAGDDARASAQFRSTLELDATFAPALLWYGLSRSERGAHAEGIALLRRAVAAADGAPIYSAGLARALALSGDRREALTLLRTVEGASYVPAYEVALVHLALGDRAKALAALRRAVEDRSHALVLLGVDRAWQPLRGDPAFQAIAREVGI